MDTAVHPEYQGFGIGKRLLQARFDLVRRMNLRGIIAGSVIMDYHRAAAEVTAEQYVSEVIAGTRFDNNLSKQMRMGFTPLNLIPNYVPDWRSLNWGVAIIWRNPDYRARSQSVRPAAPRRPFVQPQGRQAPRPLY